MPKTIKGAVGLNGQVYRKGDEEAFAAALKEADMKPKAQWYEGATTETATGFDLETATKAEMEKEAERRGITVTRADGKDGEPLSSDYREALK